MSNLELDYAHKFSELRQIKEEMRKKDSEIERLTRDLDVSKTSYEVLDERYWKSAAEKEQLKSEIKRLSDALFDCEEHRIGEEGSQAEIDAYRAAFGAKE